MLLIGMDDTDDLIKKITELVQSFYKSLLMNIIKVWVYQSSPQISGRKLENLFTFCQPKFNLRQQMLTHGLLYNRP